MKMNIKSILTVIAALIVFVSAEAAHCAGAAHSKPSIAAIVGYEHRPTRATLDHTVSVSGKISNTHSIGFFGKYRYNLVTDNAYQGLGGVFIKKTLNEVHSFNTSYAFVQIYGNRKSDSDRFSLSYSNNYYIGKKVLHKATFSYSTETDFSSGRSLSAKTSSVIKTSNKKLNLGGAYGITYNLNNDRVTLHKADADVKYSVKQKQILSLRYSYLKNRGAKTDADDIVSVQYTVAF